MKKETNSDASKIMKFVLKKILKKLRIVQKKIYLCETACNSLVLE